MMRSGRKVSEEARGRQKIGEALPTWSPIKKELENCKKFSGFLTEGSIKWIKNLKRQFPGISLAALFLALRHATDESKIREVIERWRHDYLPEPPYWKKGVPRKKCYTFFITLIEKNAQLLTPQLSSPKEDPSYYNFKIMRAHFRLYMEDFLWLKGLEETYRYEIPIGILIEILIRMNWNKKLQISFVEE